MMSGITTRGTHAPFVNFVDATITRTIPVATDPKPLITTLRFHPFSRSVWWWRTIPNWESVKDVNTPTA